MSTIVTERQLLSETIPAVTRRQLARLRRQKKLPYLRLGDRSFLYDRERVLEALERLEVKTKDKRKGTATAK